MTDKERRANYKAAFDTSAGEAVMLDLMAQARLISDLSARAGALELISYIYESTYGKASEETQA